MAAPDQNVQTQYSSRGQSQWVYGEVSISVGLPSSPNTYARAPRVPAQITGMQTLAEILEVTPSDVVTDLGSGIGQVPLYLGLAGKCARAIGVELVEHRHDTAVEARRALGLPEEAVELRCEDMLTTDLSSTTKIFCNNTVFGDALTSMLAQRLGAPDVTPDLRLCCLANPFRQEDCDSANLRLCRISSVAVNWNRSGWPMYIYQRSQTPATTADDGAASPSATTTATGTGATPDAAPVVTVDPSIEAMLASMRSKAEGHKDWMRVGVLSAEIQSLAAGGAKARR